VNHKSLITELESEVWMLQERPWAFVICYWHPVTGWRGIVYNFYGWKSHTLQPWEQPPLKALTAISQKASEHEAIKINLLLNSGLSPNQSEWWLLTNAVLILTLPKFNSGTCKLLQCKLCTCHLVKPSLCTYFFVIIIAHRVIGLSHFTKILLNITYFFSLLSDYWRNTFFLIDRPLDLLQCIYYYNK